MKYKTKFLCPKCKEETNYLRLVMLVQRVGDYSLESGIFDENDTLNGNEAVSEEFYTSCCEYKLKNNDLKKLGLI